PPRPATDSRPASSLNVSTALALIDANQGGGVAVVGGQVECENPRMQRHCRGDRDKRPGHARTSVAPMRPFTELLRAHHPCLPLPAGAAEECCIVSMGGSSAPSCGLEVHSGKWVVGIAGKKGEFVI